MGTILKLLLGVGTGGGTFLLSLLGTVLPGLATSIGDIFIKAKQTEASRQAAEDSSGTQVATGWLGAVTEANRARAQVRKDEGAWGPMGIITFMIGVPLVYHAWQVVLDSSPFHPGITTVWLVIPWVEWIPHKVGSWGVAALPGKWADTELAIMQALFYVAPPAAAAVVVAKAFRR